MEGNQIPLYLKLINFRFMGVPFGLFEGSIKKISAAHRCPFYCDTLISA
jgi:hypothetical protein